MNDSESDAMWKIYSRGAVGVAIQSTVSRVMQSFDKATDTVYMSEVQYADPDKLVEPDSIIAPSDYIFKRSAFRHEQEVRSGTTRPDVRMEFFDDLGKLKIPAPGVTAAQVVTFPDRKGIYVTVDVPTLVERIVISPFAPNWFSELVASLTQKLGYTFAIVSSEMSRPSILPC